jgi:hypothetical protein
MIREDFYTVSGSRIQDPGVKKAPDPGSGSATLTKSLKDIHVPVYFRYRKKDDADGTACFGGVSPRKPRPYKYSPSHKST